MFSNRPLKLYSTRKHLSQQWVICMRCRMQRISGCQCRDGVLCWVAFYLLLQRLETERGLRLGPNSVKLYISPNTHTIGNISIMSSRSLDKINRQGLGLFKKIECQATEILYFSYRRLRVASKKRTLHTPYLHYPTRN